VINGFMIQGGGYTPDLKEKPTNAPIPLESRNGLKNDRGTIAMARTGVPDSATSQFFINVADNNRLNYPEPDGHGYAVFGHVVEGMDVVDRIRAVPTVASGPHQNLPAKPIIVRAARVITGK
jgi:peptidyl-prolyl cis-trans isomerase A (cyclophilin A)